MPSISILSPWRRGISAQVLARNTAPDRFAYLNVARGLQTILLLSRDIDSRILIRNAFLNRGCLVLQAVDEQQASFIYSQMRGNIDLVIVDTSSAQMGGLGQWRHCTPKVLMLVDPANEPSDMDVLGPQVQYITKPFTSEDIIAKVQCLFDSHRKKVLIVDDDESLRHMLAALLEAAGYEVAQASNGREVLTRAGALEADIVLTEIVMPEVEGLQLIRELSERNPGLNIVAMSGSERAESYLAVATSLGAKASLIKPLNAEELLRILRDVNEDTREFTEALLSELRAINTLHRLSKISSSPTLKANAAALEARKRQLQAQFNAWRERASAEFRSRHQLPPPVDEVTRKR